MDSTQQGVDMFTRKVLPPTCLLIAMLAMPILGFFFPMRRIIPPYWNLLGLLPLGIGVLLNLFADQALHQAQTTVKPFDESSSLVTRGVYQISRNPMYLGFALILVGIAVLLTSLSPYLVVVLFIYLIDRVFIQVEEKMLHGKFGDQWEAYSKRIHRWI
jgi:protein-S-isoprenylcysteine O-methyltransferase Ste14